MHHLLTGVAGNGVIFAQENRLLGTNLFAHAAVDAADHVDVEFLGIFFHFGKPVAEGISPGMILMARGGQMNSQSWQATQRTRSFSSFTNAGAPR